MAVERKGALAVVEHPFPGAAGEQPPGAFSTQRQMPLACWCLPSADAPPGCLVPHRPEVCNTENYHLRHRQRKQNRSLLVSPCWILWPKWTV